MPPDMASDNGDEDERLEELYAQLQAISAEVAEIKARRRAAQQTPEERRSHFTVIRGGITAIAPVAGVRALLRRRPRHPVALTGALAGLGAIILTLTVPTGGTAPPSNPSVVLSDSVALPPFGAHTTAAATASTTAPPPATTAHYPAPRPVPSSSSTAPTAMPTYSTPPPPQQPGSPPATPSPTPTVPCLVSARVPGVLHICLV